MSINQVNPELNDAFETYFPKAGFFGRNAWRVATKALELGVYARRRIFRGKLMVNERIVEYPMIFRWLRPGGRVLDIGCQSSRLPINLASMGYEVHGLDVLDYGFDHPNFHFHKGDVFEWAPPMKFDTVIAVSVIEHFGLGSYGDMLLEAGDKKAVEKISGFIKCGGQLLVSMPYGNAGLTSRHRIYDDVRLASLFQDFETEGKAFFIRIGEHWLPSTPEELGGIDSPDLPPRGVVVLNLKKPCTKE